MGTITQGVLYMGNFVMKKSKNSNIIKSIRFSEELNDKINAIVEEANKGKKKKEYSFNGFVVSACQYAIDNMKK